MGAVVVGLAVGVALWPRAEPTQTAEPVPAAIEKPAVPAPSVTTPLSPPVTLVATTNALGRFEGEVVDLDQAPIANAELEFDNGPQTTRVTTDSEGHFSAELGAGEWWLRITAAGHLGYTDSTHYISASGTVVTDLRFVLEPARQLKGLVIDEAGAPVADAGVALGGDFVAFAGFSDDEVARTDTSGKFTAQIGLKLWRYENVLEVSHDCCLPHRERLQDGLQDLDVVIRLRKVSFTITPFRGIVVDGYERPVPEANVSAIGWANFDGGQVRRHQTTVTDADGAFTVLLPGDSMRAWAQFGSQQSDPVELHKGEGGKLVLSWADATVTGRVMDEAGHPVTRFSAHLRDRDLGSEEASSYAVTGDGTFRLKRLTSGPKKLVLYADGFVDPPARQLELAPHEDRVGVDFVLSRGRTLRGRVTDERTGAGLADAGVRGGGKGTRTDAHGQFVLAALPLTTVDLKGDFGEGYVDRMVQVKAGNLEPVLIALRARESDDGGYRRDYEGIGVQLDFNRVLDGGNGYPVLRLLPTGGAHAAGVLVGDEVLAADDTEAGALPFEDFNSLIKGPAGTAVKLTIRRDGREFDVRVSRKRLAW